MKYDNDDKNSSSISYGLIIIAFIVFWPAGIFLLLMKFGILDSLISSLKQFGGNKKFDGSSQQRERFQKYKIMTSGRSSESIEYLASAVGVSYESALRDIQQMVMNGDFGPDAYINYLNKTIVLSQTKKSASDDRANSENSTDNYGFAKAVSAIEELFKTQAQENNNAKDTKASAKAPEKRKREKKFKPFGSLPTWLGIIGVGLLICGIVQFIGAMDSLIWLDSFRYVLDEFLGSVFCLAGGAASFIARRRLNARVNRMKAYIAAMVGRDYISLEELRSVAGVNAKTLQRDLEAMLSKGLLGSEAYIDQGDQILILKAGVSPSFEEDTEMQDDDYDNDQYSAILREIREVNDAIPDPEISARIDEIEELTAKIFKTVQDKPEKLPQIKSFMSYYLPTTLKLLHSYADFDKAGTDGENIRAAKADIERILDMLVDGFKKQLDKLYEADAMDISSDINVLENMLRRDGLSGDGSDFGSVSGGH